MNTQPRAQLVRGGARCGILVGFLLVVGWCVLAPAESRRSHLPFFHENRAFILQAWEMSDIDRHNVKEDTRGWDFDPFADWNAEAAVREARALFDSATTPDDLGRFHASLDSLLEAMRLAAARLDDLDFRFSEHVRTGLEVTLAAPHKLDIVRVEADVEGVVTLQHDLTGAERAALVAGGILEVLRQAVEPRQHDIEVRTWVRGQEQPSITHVVFHPTPNELVRVHLQLQNAHEPAQQQRTQVTKGS
jgi:hypothetical protein